MPIILPLNGNYATELTPMEERIIKVLLESGMPLSTTEVAKKARISWNTAHRHLHEFLMLKWVKDIKVGRKVLWKTKVKGD